MKKNILSFLILITTSLTTYAAIPGMKGTDHVGVTVPSLEQAVNFFVDVMGCEPFYQLGPFADSEGNWMKDHLNVHPRAQITKMQLVRCGNGSNLELFEYSAPEQNQAIPNNSDIGGHHLGFYVEDINKAVAYLKEKGLTILGEPKTMNEGPSAGESWLYFLSPWGLQLELVSYPNGKAYEKSGERKLFSPNQN